MTHLDLFSGIGGFALAARWAGFTTIGFSEIDPYATAVLKRHWPDVPNHGDIRTIRNVRADLITGGFPCQPFSCAGKRKGKADDRHLWPEMCRVIKETGPAWVVGENVTGLIDLALDLVLFDLEAIGYACRAVVIPACAVDAKHRRDRVWVVAHSGGVRLHELPHGQGGIPDPLRPGGHAPDVFVSAGGVPPDTRTANVAAETSADVSAGQPIERDQQSGSYTLRQQPYPRHQGSDSGDRQVQAQPQRVGRERAWCQWPPEPGVGRVAHGIPHRAHRIKGLGNAIVPQVAYQILRVIADIEGLKPSSDPIPAP